jgi:uncharacterized protein
VVRFVRTGGRPMLKMMGGAPADGDGHDHGHGPGSGHHGLHGEGRGDGHEAAAPTG